MKWPVFPLLAILLSDELQGAGIGWMKVDSNGRATPAEHQVKQKTQVRLGLGWPKFWCNYGQLIR